MEFSVKNKTLAMTSKMHLALFLLAKTFLLSCQGIWGNLSARILLESEFYLYFYYPSKFLFRKVYPFPLYIMTVPLYKLRLSVGNIEGKIFNREFIK